MHFSLNNTDQRQSQRRVIAAVLLLVACVATAMGQSGSRDLFSAPPVSGSAPSIGPIGEGPLPITQQLLPGVGQSSVFGTPAPGVDLSDTSAGSAVGQPATVATPSLLSTPSTPDVAPTTPDVVESPVAVTPTGPPVAPPPANTDSSTPYSSAISLWGASVEQPAMNYPASPAQPYYGAPGDAPVQYQLAPTAGGSCGAGCGGGGHCGLGCKGCRGCGSGQCANLCGCGPRTWGRFDVLLWNISGYDTPPLITGVPGNGVQNGAGALGGQGTQVLFGNRQLGDDLLIGGRFQYGAWFDECRTFGIQADFFGLASDDQSQTFSGNGNDIFARPFFNTNPNVNAQDAQVFALPGLAEGSVRFEQSSQVFSAGPALRYNLCCTGGCDPCNPSPVSRRVDLLLGYRFFRLEEEFSSQEVLNVTDPSFVDGTSFELNDRIRTRNDFHGIELGLNRLTQRGRWLCDITALVALGEVERVVDLDGSTRVNVPGFSDNTFPGGFFVGPGDIGRFRDNDFAAIPQVRANIGYCLGRNWRLNAGYNFLFLSSAFRPGQFLNTQFDGARLGQEVDVDTVRQPNFRRESLFLHGANVGLSRNF